MPTAEARDEPIQRLADFLVKFQGLPVSPKLVNVYRGHPLTTYELSPRLFRRGNDIDNRKNERSISKELICLHPEEFAEDRSVFEQLVRMQHYSLPTRLLDVTYNPLVALYFTCSKDAGQPGEFIRFTVPKVKLRYFDSDTVSCIANLSNLSARERNALSRMEDLAELNNSAEGDRLLQFIKSEKPYFRPNIRPEDLKSVVLVKPKLNNRRILSQQGAFLTFGLCSTLEPENFGIGVEKIPILAAAKRRILRDLDSVNMNDSSLFAGLETSAKYIMSKLEDPED